MRRKHLAIVALATGLLLVTVIVLFLIDFDSPEIGRRFMEKLSQSTDLQWSAGRFRLNLLRGLYLENVTTGGDIAGRRMDAPIHKITVRHRLLPVLRGEISARDIVLEDLQVDLFPAAPDQEQARAKERKEHSAPAASPGESSAPATGPNKELQLNVSQLLIENATITVHSAREKKPEAVIEALTLTLNDLTLREESGPVMQRFSAKGKLRADQILVGKTQAEKSEAKIEISGGQIYAKELSFETELGKFMADLSMNINSNPITYSISLQAESLNTNVAIGGKENDALGPTRLSFQGKGIGPRSADLQGEGTFTVADGHLPSFPVFETIDRIIGKTVVVGAPYKTRTTSFQVGSNRINLHRFIVDIEQGSMDLSGWITLNGPVRLDCKVRIPRENVKIKELPRELIDALTDDAGSITLPFRIRGTAENPITELDTGTVLAQAGEGTKRILKKKLSEKIKDLLKKRKH